MSKRILARNDEHPDYYDPGLPRGLDDALSTCVKCPCGGQAITARLINALPDRAMFRDKSEDNALICDACEERAVEYVDDWITTAGAWNREIEQEACVHSWFRQADGGFKCCHCGALLRQ